MTKRTDAWFQTGPVGEQAGLNMFCFPYAGGAALVFKKWGDFLPPTVQVIPVELPGRGNRLQEPPFVSLPPLISELEDAIHPLLGKPFVFFGHSMGAIIAFELAQSLRRKYGREPQALFVAGRRAPQAPDDEPITYDLPKDKFIEELIKLDGTPREVIEHAELMELMIPLLRADFQLIQTYEYLAETPLSCPIVAFGGLQDAETPREKLLPWKELTGSRFVLHMLSGDHFFIRSSQSHLLRLVARELYDVFALYHLNNARAK
jgi:medium-chain acyl-[acyl-carrier-protein] hydrolase